MKNRQNLAPDMNKNNCKEGRTYNILREPHQYYGYEMERQRCAHDFNICQ